MRDTLSSDLLARHLATEAQVAEAYRAHDEDGGAFPTKLVQAGVRAGDVLMALARICSLAPVPGSRLRYPERGIGAGLDPAPFWKLMAAPFGRVGDELLVAFADPAMIPLAGPEGLPRHRAHVGLEADVRMALRALFSSPAPLAPRLPTPVPPPGPPPTSEESEALEVELDPDEELAVSIDEPEEGMDDAAALVAEELEDGPAVEDTAHGAAALESVSPAGAVEADALAFDEAAFERAAELPDFVLHEFEATAELAGVAPPSLGVTAELPDATSPAPVAAAELPDATPPAFVATAELPGVAPPALELTAELPDATSPAPVAAAELPDASPPASAAVPVAPPPPLAPAAATEFARSARAAAALPRPLAPVGAPDPRPEPPRSAASPREAASAPEPPTPPSDTSPTDPAFDSIEVALEEPPAPLDPALEAALESPRAANTPVEVVSFAARRKLVPGGASRAPLETTPGPSEPVEPPREERTGLWAMPPPPPEPPLERPREERTGLWAMPPPPPEPPKLPATDRTGVWELPQPSLPATDRTGVWETVPSPIAPAGPAGPERTGIWAGAAVAQAAQAPGGPRVVGDALLPPEGAPSVASTQEKLATAMSEGDVASTLVTFAAAWFPRTLVFARRDGELRGLLGRGLGRPSYEVAALRLLPALLPPGYGPGPIGPALDALWRVYGGLPQALIVRELPAVLGEPWLLIGDVPNVSARYHDLHPLELVLRSAGEALDRIIALR